MEAPEYFQSSGYYTAQFTPEKRVSVAGDAKNSEQFVVEEFFDFSNEEEDDDGDNVVVSGDGAGDEMLDAVTAGNNSSESSTITVVDSCISSLSPSGSEPPHVLGDAAYSSFADGNDFSNHLCVPLDELAELEWMSNFAEESFSSEDLQKLQLISGMKVRPDKISSETQEFQPEPNNSSTMFRPEMPVPGKARSKRSRAPCNWTSRLLVLSPTSSSSSSESDVVQGGAIGKKTVKTMSKKREELSDYGMGSGDGRKCLHCATDKTPQWRTGPMGPKTLCNACGVRYKSGRLVPEYRPAASPTFVLTKHSNSHRKVMELRRQKEVVRSHQHHYQPPQFLHHRPSMMFDVSNGDDYLIHQNVGPDFQQLIQ